MNGYNTSYNKNYQTSSRPAHRAEEKLASELIAKIKFADSVDKLEDDKIFSEYAEELAKEISTNRNANKRTQIRKFYDELVMWDDKVNSNSDESERKYAENKALLKMMKAKVAYSKGRKHIDGKFMEFFNHCMDQVTSARKLHQFKLFFEAFMGYYRIHKND